MDQLRWKRGGAILPNIKQHELQREPGRRRRPERAGKRRRLVLLNATGKVGAGKERRSLKRSSTHTPRSMTPRQRAIHERRLASEQAMRRRKEAA